MVQETQENLKICFIFIHFMMDIPYPLPADTCEVCAEFGSCLRVCDTSLSLCAREWVFQCSGKHVNTMDPQSMFDICCSVISETKRVLKLTLLTHYHTEEYLTTFRALIQATHSVNGTQTLCDKRIQAVVSGFEGISFVLKNVRHSERFVDCVYNAFVINKSSWHMYGEFALYEVPEFLSNVIAPFILKKRRDKGSSVKIEFLEESDKTSDFGIGLLSVC